MKRVVTAELLDEDLGTPEEIRDSLLDLRGFNEHFGGFSSVAGMLRAVATENRARRLSFLDVAGGNGDVARRVTQELSSNGIELRPTVLDRAISHMNRLQIARVAGDALSLPLADCSYDVVGCNLFLHHLEPDQMIAFFNDALRVCRMAVIASDLRRTLFHWIAAYVGQFTYRSRITRHDAPVSVRRAYTIPEIESITKQTTGARIDLQTYHFQRFGLILWKTQS